MDNEIDQLLSLSRQINAHAHKGEWEQVEPLQAQRTSLLDALDSLDQANLDTQSDRLREVIQEVKRLDAESLLLAGQQKQQLSSDHSQHMKGKKMQRAYSALK